MTIRLFVTSKFLSGEIVTVDDRQAHYLATVMRLITGETLHLFNGKDGEFLAKVETISRKAVTLRVQNQTRRQEAEPDAWLCFALLKRQKTDLVIEKATELGVAEIQPVITARTQTDHVNLDRLRAIAIEAAEQCERLAVPEIRPPITLAQMLAGWGGRKLFVADERRTAKLLSFAAGPAALLIGPEGGFTDAELAAIGAHPCVTRVSLGARILRAETAAIAGLTLLLAAHPPAGEEE